ncbi:MAG: hypothetical protein GEV07_13890 [Streptosporangiales bacterium]|nr:hypothetical protein [Streptosporangiales bacterium]
MSFAPIRLNPDQTLIDLLGGTMSLLPLGVFTVVDVAVLVLRRQPVGHAHFRAPTVVPVIGAVCCLFLVMPLSGRAATEYWV